MTSPWILKIPNSDPSRDAVLVHVSRERGGRELDLTLYATDGELPFKCKVKHKKIKDLQTSKYDGTDDEWAGLLHYALVSKQPSTLSSDLKASLATVATVDGTDPKRVLTISIRNRIDEITQKLGRIDLKQTADEIQLFDWAGLAVDAQCTLQRETEALRTQTKSDQETIASLKAQINDLIKAKANHETQLLSKFALLLNEKKRKVRMQQRILSTAKVDKRKLEELKLIENTTSRGKAGHSKKRQAAGDAESSEDGFETMKVDTLSHRQDVDHSSRHTTPESETEGETDDDEPAADAVALSAQGTKTWKRPASSNDPPTSPPPRRQLPFAKKEAKADAPALEKGPSQPAPDSDEATASDDDEL